MSQTIKVQKYYELDFPEQVEMGIWRGDCSRLRALCIHVIVENHHAFAVNWMDHKSNEIFAHVRFADMEPQHMARYAIDVRILGRKFFPSDVVKLEGEGAIFLKDEHYQKLMYGIFKELGT